MLAKLFNPYVVALLLWSGLSTDARNSLLRAGPPSGPPSTILDPSGLSANYVPADQSTKPEIYGSGWFDAAPGLTYTVDLIITPVYTSGEGLPIRAATVSATAGAIGDPFQGTAFVSGDALNTYNPPLATLGWYVQIAITGTGTDGSYYITPPKYFSIQPGG